CALQVAQFGAGDFTIHLGQRLLAAHGQYGMPKSNNDPEQPECLSNVSILKEAQGLRAELKVCWNRERRQVGPGLEHRIKRPYEQNHYHHCSDLHDSQGLVAGFLNPLDVLPPVIKGHNQGKGGSRMVHVELRRAMKHGVHGPGNPAMSISSSEELVD